MRDYINLCKATESLDTQRRVGSDAMDYYFLEHRLRTKNNHGISFREWLSTEGYNHPRYMSIIAHKLGRGVSLMRARHDAYCVYGSAVAAFKPLLARTLFQIYKPTSILDFCAGWGGRCLAAMSLNIDYIGFDTNETLLESYTQMMNTYPCDSAVEIQIRDSSLVDYSQYSYDMVFTSPPYYKKTPTEIYEHMPHYVDRADFNERFLFPTVRNTYQHLTLGGIYAINIPSDMYDELVPILGECHTKHRLAIRKRSKESSYKEFIYVWRKI